MAIRTFSNKMKVPLGVWIGYTWFNTFSWHLDWEPDHHRGFTNWRNEWIADSSDKAKCCNAEKTDSVGTTASDGRQRGQQWLGDRRRYDGSLRTHLCDSQRWGEKGGAGETENRTQRNLMIIVFEKNQSVELWHPLAALNGGGKDNK